MSMLNMTMVPTNHPNPFNPPIGPFPLLFKEVWINDACLTSFCGQALDGPDDSWPKPTFDLCLDVVGQAISQVWAFHEKEPETTIHCTPSVVGLLMQLPPRIKIIADIPESCNGVDECVVTAKHFHTKTVVIRYKSHPNNILSFP